MTPTWFTRELFPGDEGNDIREMQLALGLPATGTLDEFTEAYVRGVQRARRLPITGVVDSDTAAAIGERERARFGLPPTWFEEGRLERAWEILGTDDPDALKRFQGNRGLPATGVIDKTTAIYLGE